MTQPLKLLAIILLCSCGQRNKNFINSSDLNSLTLDSSIEISKQVDTTSIKELDNNLKFKVDSSNEEGSKVLNIYRNGKKILSHTLYKSDGDCSSVNIELGNYKLFENKIIFYSYWAATDRQNIALYPFGFRKQIYRIDETGKISKQKTELFIEDNVEKEVGKESYYPEHSNWKHKGLEFIYKTPQNDFERKVKEDYIKSIENIYKGRFVFGNAKEALEKEVRNELDKEIRLYTDNWKEGEEYGYGTVKK